MGRRPSSTVTVPPGGGFSPGGTTSTSQGREPLETSTEPTTARRIRSLRPPKPDVDPWQPIDVLREEERLPDGRRVPALTVFLAGRECPFTCVFCDLWRFTLDGPTPPGAIPAQLRQAFGQTENRGRRSDATVKLYNASNFFDAKAVPPADDAEIARLVSPFARVVVESHPKLVGRRCRRFAERLDGKLQVAMGLETVHPQALPRLGKQATLDDFRRAAELLRDDHIEIRAFVLVGAPFVPMEETVTWAERSATYAFEQGAVHVSLIPVRGGNGELERLERVGDFTPPTLAQVEETVERCLGLGNVTVDTWDLERFAECPACGDQRVARLARINLSGSLELPVPCSACAS